MGNFIGMVFGFLKEKGIDTSKMSTQEAIDKYNELNNSKNEKEPVKQKLKEDFDIDTDELDLTADELEEALKEIEAMNKPVKKIETKQEKFEFEEDDGNWKSKPYLVDDYNYDYQTGDVVGENIFDVTKTGMSKYNNFLNEQDKKYMEESKGLVGEIKQISPKEYFEESAKIFNSTFEKQKSGIASEKSRINMLKEVIQTKKKQFPMPFLNYAEKSQEGRHRMYVAGELFGWDKKFPVLVVNKKY